MLNNFEWSGIGGCETLTSSSQFVKNVLTPAFEDAANLKFVKKDGGQSYHGKVVKGWHIYGISLKKVVRKDQVESTDE